MTDTKHDKTIQKKSGKGVNCFQKLFGETTQLIKNEIQVRSKMHKAVSAFHYFVAQIYDNNKKLIQEDAKLDTAVQGFLGAIKDALEEDSKNGYSCLLVNQFALAEQVQNIIHDYQPRLESAPGFFNQLRAIINTFIEKMAGIKDILGSPDKNIISNRTGYFDKKNKIASLKQNIEDSDEDSIFSTSIRRSH
ncbi:MAG TPA: hypothetical protein PK657_01670 [Legionella sp.]|nr:hypothetical protein [Legionella sp.]